MIRRASLPTGWSDAQQLDGQLPRQFPTRTCLRRCRFFDTPKVIDYGNRRHLSP